jgi:hypothetical protein
MMIPLEVGLLGIGTSPLKITLFLLVTGPSGVHLNEIKKAAQFALCGLR